MLDTLKKYSFDVENAQYNFDLALEYDKIGHTASAISFYLRAAELSDDPELSYTALLKMGLCFEKQGNRNQTATGLYKQAISCIPERPEAYYLLSKNHTNNNLHHEAYTMIEIAISIIDPELNSLSYDVEYPGYHGLIYQKAISSWWWGKKQESRDLFKLLFQNYWDVLDENSKDVVIDNISRLGYTSNTQTTVSYDRSKHSSLRFHFTGSDQIERNYSQVYQDMFVLSMLNGKKNGTFLEVGSAHAYHNSNTALLESKFDWSGVAIELKKDLADEYASTRKSKILNSNALELDYKKLLDDNFNSNIIDYLQLDIEPAKNTYEVLLKIPFDDYKFAVITYEHDHYVDATKQCRSKSREYLRSKGYVLVVNDISADGESSFEDWWIHPELVDQKIVSIMADITEYLKQIDNYFLTPSIQLSELNLKINSNFSPTCWIVDNFYEDPDAVRKFALSQEYVEGGFGRGFIGRRTENQFLFPGLKSRFEEIMGMKITEWESHGMNGRFQNAHAGEPLVWHCDSQKWGGMLYLTPDAPYQCGTTLYAHKQTRARSYYDEGWDASWKDIPGDPHLDGTSFEPVDVLGNVYNRLVIFDASNIHSASEYFGTVMENSRLWQMFFFDTELVK